MKKNYFRRCARILTKEEKCALEKSFWMAFNGCRCLLDVCEDLNFYATNHREKEALYKVYSSLINKCGDLRYYLKKVFPAEDRL